MVQENKQDNAAPRSVRLQELYLDPNNFRLIHEKEHAEVKDDAQIKKENIAARTYRLLAGKNNQNIQDLVESFKSNGYLPVDQIQVRKLDGGGYVVVEGNRRIAALRFLEREYKEKHIELHELDENIFTNVPVVLYEDKEDVHYLTLMGLKHISGNRKWGEWNQASLIWKLVKTHNIAEDNACGQIGITKHELRRSIRAFSLSNQYRESDYGDQFKESMFPCFREAVYSQKIKDWLKWSEGDYRARKQENTDLFFSWLSQELIEPTEEDSGYSRQYLAPAISTRDHVRTLSKIIDDKHAIEKLKESRDINEAYRSSKLLLGRQIEDTIESVKYNISSLGSFVISPEQAAGLEGYTWWLRNTVQKALNSKPQEAEQTLVFRENINDINSHFSSVKVHSFRCLRELEVRKLSRINLFAGVNNSGKTSFLEALYLLCKQNNFNGGLADVLRRRGKMRKGSFPSQLLSDQITEEIAVEGVFNKQKSSVAIRPIKENKVFDRQTYLKSVQISAQFGKHNQESLIRIHEGRRREILTKSMQGLTEVFFSSPFFLNQPEQYTALYYKSVQSRLFPRIREFIQKKIVTTIMDIRLVDDFQRFLVDDELIRKGTIDITSYGEGLQRIFFISMLFAAAKNGVVLIDEIENAIHAELIKDFAGFIHELAMEFNVQVFLTSHSKECIDSFVNADSKNDDFAFHAFVRNDKGGISVREFKGKEFYALLEAGNVDLRKAR